jgi:hypothetical protein
MVWLRSLSVPLGEVNLAADLLQSATTKYSFLLCPGMRRAGVKVADKQRVQVQLCQIPHRQWYKNPLPASCVNLISAVIVAGRENCLIQLLELRVLSIETVTSIVFASAGKGRRRSGACFS